VTPKALEALGKALIKDNFWGVQAEVAKVLGSIKNESALDQLLKGIAVTDSRARTDVAAALGNFYQNNRAFDALEKLLDDEDSYFVVASAATSIGQTKHKLAFELLKKRIKDVPSTWTEIVKRGYLSGIKETEKEEAIEIIVEYTRPGVPDYIRREVPAKLAALGKRYKKKHPEIKSVLETLLYDKSYRVQMGAISATKVYGDSSLLPALTKLAESSVESGIVRSARVAIRALGKKKDSTEVASIRKSVEELERENRDLKDRIAKVETLLEKNNE
ncbi:MAG: HEAT repeat domain-containing protein, partial [Candidatus Thorarchaeota archaeon]|nr:HEAT repeat domain-containing protein [Candidatus Thorarchaeota archaeon]